MPLRYEWDPVKAASNRRKHGVSFEAAVRVFVDPNAIFEYDRMQNGELRWHAIGMVEEFIVLLVVHVVDEDKDGETIRIISARRANRVERGRYEEANS